MQLDLWPAALLLKPDKTDKMVAYPTYRTQAAGSLSLPSGAARAPPAAPRLTHFWFDGLYPTPAPADKILVKPGQQLLPAVGACPQRQARRGVAERS